MEIKLININKNQIKASVSLDHKDLQKHIEEAENIIGSEVEIKGFRKGKAPKDLIKKNVGQEKIRALALEIALEKSLSEAIKANSLDVLDTSQLSIEKNDATQ